MFTCIINEEAPYVNTELIRGTKQALSVNSKISASYNEILRPSIYVLTIGMDSYCWQDKDYIYIKNGILFNEPRFGNFYSLDDEKKFIQDCIYHGEVDRFTKVTGQYIIAFYDKSKRKFMLWNDYYGIKSLFYKNKGPQLIVSSRYQVISESLNQPKKLNYKAMDEYFSIGMVLEGKTFYKEIDHLPAGNKLFYYQNNLSIKKRREKEFSSNLMTQSIETISELFLENLTEASTSLIKRYHIENMLITGGSDSRVLLGALSESQKKELQFTTFKQPKWSPDNWDAIIAKDLAKNLNLKHQEIEFDDIPNNLPMAYKAYHFNHMSTPTLTGSFGTELAGQGVWMALSFKYKMFDFEQHKSLRRRLFSQNYLKKNRAPFLEIIKNIELRPGPCREYQYLVPYLWKSFFSDTYSAFNTHVYISAFENQNGYKISPFLHPNIINLLYNLPEEYLINYRLYDTLFKNSLKYLNSIPFNSNISKYSTVVKGVPKNQNKHATCPFPYNSFLQKHANHEVFELDFFNNSEIRSIINYPPTAEFNVRLVDFIFWYENAIKKNYHFETTQY